MANTLKIKRGTKNQLDNAGGAGGLNPGEPYLITDQSRIAVGLTTSSYQSFAKLDEINAGTLTVSIAGSNAASGTALSWGTTTGFTANSSGSTIYDLKIGPALTSLAVAMNSGNNGFIKKSGTDTYSIDTNTYVTTSGSLNSLGGALTANYDLGGTYTITGVKTPSNTSDAVPKSYVDSAISNAIQGLDPKASVRVATNGVLTAAYSNTQGTLTNSGTRIALAIDGINLVVNDRVLVKNQANPFQNGIYTVTDIGSASIAWVLTRALDMDSWSEIPGAYTFVEEGTDNKDRAFLVTADQGGTIGSTDITITQFGVGGGTTYTASTGLTLVGSDFRISSSYTGQSSITTLGTIATGTWNATAIDTQYGGTGLNSYAIGDIIYANGANTLTKLTKPVSTNPGILTMNSSGVPSWMDVIDGGSF